MNENNSILTKIEQRTGMMKNLICLILLSLSLMIGCSKPESKPVNKAAAGPQTDSKTAAAKAASNNIVGTWKYEDKKIQMGTVVFLNDNTGYIIDHGEKSPPVKWSALKDGTYLVTDENQKTYPIKFVGEKIKIGGISDLLIKEK
jgi:hypothetical protein